MLSQLILYIVQTVTFTFNCTYLINSIRPTKVKFSERATIFVIYGLTILFSLFVGNIAVSFMLLCVCLFFIIKKEHILINVSDFRAFKMFKDNLSYNALHLPDLFPSEYNCFFFLPAGDTTDFRD